MSASTFTAAFATTVYIYLLAVFISWWLFLLPNQYLPTVVASTKFYTMEFAPAATSIGQIVFYNIASMFAFGFFHSLLARKSTKQYMNIPTSVERPMYCLQSAFFLHMIQHCWVDIEGWNVWDASNSPLIANILVATYWFGVLFILSSTFALDHFHLFGLSQGFGVDINKALGLALDENKEEGGLATRWHYKYVAHPIMTGMFISFWATPVMTPGRLVCAAFFSLYVLIAVIHYEERSIRTELGSDYEEYLAKTPRFFPNPLSSVSIKATIKARKQV